MVGNDRTLWLHLWRRIGRPAGCVEGNARSRREEPGTSQDVEKAVILLHLFRLEGLFYAGSARGSIGKGRRCEDTPHQQGIQVSGQLDRSSPPEDRGSSVRPRKHSDR
jgi:hypothetical protein